MSEYSKRVCIKCSHENYSAWNNHEKSVYKDLTVWSCCQCGFQTYFSDGDKELSKEEVFERYPEFLEQKKVELAKLWNERCSKCNRSGQPNMWCWKLPWCSCHVKTLREEIEGACQTPLSAKEFLDGLERK